MVDELGRDLGTAPTMNPWWFMAKKAKKHGLVITAKTGYTATINADFERMQSGNPAPNQPVAELNSFPLQVSIHHG